MSPESRTHEAPQAVWPAGQIAPPITQAPISQRCPAPHTLPQNPQFAALICVLTHSPPQLVVPIGQLTIPPEHAPPMHTWPAAHALPHAPQCKFELAVDTHDPLQGVWPTPQGKPTHTPPEQA
jgi:hypothetical protein